MSRRTPAILFALAACAEQPVATSVEVPAGGAIVVAIHDAADNVLEVQILRPGSSYSIASPEGGDAVVWALDPTRLLNPDGTPLAANMIENVTVRLTGAQNETANGSCRRCPTPDEAAREDETQRQVVYPGSSCAPPRFSALKNGRGANPNDAHRKAVRLDWPGACGCTIPPLVPSIAEIEVVREEGGTPLSQLELWDRAVLFEDASVALLGDRQVVYLNPDGSERSREIFDESMRFQRPIVRTIPMSNNRFAAMEFPESAMQMVFTGAVFSPRRPRQEISIRVLPEPMQPATGTPLPNDTGFVGGRTVEGQTGSVCSESSPGSWLCARVTHSPNNEKLTPSRVYQHSISFGDGSVLAVTEKAELFLSQPLPNASNVVAVVEDPPIGTGGATAVEGRIRRSDGGETRFRRSYVERLEPPYDNYDIMSLAKLGRLGKQAFACGHAANRTEADQNRTIVLTRRIDDSVFPANGAALPGDALEWEVAYCGPWTVCRGFALERTATSTIIAAYFEGDKKARFDASGRSLDPVPAEICGPRQLQRADPGKPFRRLESPYAGRDLGWMRDLSVYTKIDGGPFRRIFGPENYDPRLIHAAITDRDRVWGFGSFGRVIHFGPNDDTWRTLPVETTGPWLNAGSTLIDATYDHARDRAVLTGMSAFDCDPENRCRLQGWMQSFEISSDRVRELGPPVIFESGDDPLLPIDAAEVVPGTILVATLGPVNDRFLLRVRGDSYENIPLDLIDPVTGKAFETREQESLCAIPLDEDPLRLSPGNNRGVRHIAAGQGVAWAVGCDGAVFRIDALSDPPRAYFFDMKGRAAIESLVNEPPDYSGVSVACGDNVYFAAPEVNTSPRGSEAHVWSLSGGPDSETLKVRDVATLPSVAALLVGSGPLMEIMPQKDGTMFLLYTTDDEGDPAASIEGVGTNQRRRLELPFTAAIQRERDLVIFTDSPRVLLVRPE